MYTNLSKTDYKLINNLLNTYKTPTVSYGKKTLVYTKVCFVRSLVRFALCAGLCAGLVRWVCA